MAEKMGKFDFERNWQEKLSRAVESAAGEKVRDLVLQGGDTLTQETGTTEKIIWTCRALDLLAESTDEKTGREILTGCACHYPVEDLGDVKEVFQSSGDIDQAIQMLQGKFERFTRETLGLEEELAAEIISRGWQGTGQGILSLPPRSPKAGHWLTILTKPIRRRSAVCTATALGCGTGLDWNRLYLKFTATAGRVFTRASGRKY